MYLNHKGLTDTQEWLNRGYKLPQFDIEQVTQDTKKAPTWIHFGAGNIFRAFPAKVVQHLLEQEVLTKGLIMCEGYDYEIIDQIDQKHHNLNILVTLKADGSVEKTVLASIVESLKLDPMIEDYKRLKEIFENPSLQMVSFTITEKGYSLKDQTGQYICDVAADIKTGPQTCQSYMGKVVSLLYHRYQNSHSPIAMVSLDNCSHNGDKLKDAVTTLAQEWVLHGFVDEGFVSYVNDPIHVSFP